MRKSIKFRVAPTVTTDAPDTAAVTVQILSDFQTKENVTVSQYSLVCA